MSELHVFRNQVIDWVIAASPEDADAVCVDYYDDPPDDPGAWIQLPDDRVLWIIEDGVRVEKTCAEWVAQKGRGFIASTEF